MPIFRGASPPVYVWSRQPIVYTLLYNGLVPGRSIQVQVMDTATNTPLGEALRYTIPAASGLLAITDLEKIIDPYLSYPNILLGDAATEQAIDLDMNMKKTVHLRYRQYSLTSPPETWTEDIAYKFTVLKGGIGEMNFTDEYENNRAWYSHLFYPNVDGNAHPWMSFRPVFGNKIHAKEMRWLLYHHTDNGFPKIRYQVFYTDGTNTTFNRLPASVSAPHNGKLLRIPIGIVQAALNPYNKTVQRYKVDALSDNTVRATMEFEVDNRPVHQYMNLIYRNSVGGIETIFLTGVNEVNGAKFEKREFERNRIVNYNSSGVNTNFHSEGRLTFKGNTPYMSKKELMLLYDLYNSQDVCGMIYKSPYQGNKLYPMKVPAQDMVAISSEANLHNYTVEFETAGSFRNLPRQMFNII